ncbi:PQQ-binding-like beta-propeller repeat protein [Streptomyces sp. NPDC014891]|uniref:outer membrane protein assembly factor BamB family protein n=1 Tax=Streptomyces sp. NPDC014891 TaxID=3364929 RepID=UPI003700E510
MSALTAFACFVLSSEGYLPGDGMSRVWDTPADRDVPDHGNASWLHDDVVARARFDAVTGFDVSTGRERWEYAVPDVAEICATSATADRDGIVVIAFGTESGTGTAAGGCATVAAIDLDTGEELWRTSAPSASSLTGNHDLVAVGGGVAVVRETRPDGDTAIRAFDATAGTPRWTAKLSPACGPQGVGASEHQVVAVLECEGSGLRLAAFSLADGTARWSVPLDTRRPLAPEAAVSLRSVEPLVVHAEAPQERGTHAFLAFASDGKPRGRIDLTGEYGEIQKDGAAKVAIADDRLIAVAEYPYESSTREQIVAFDLDTGEPVWRHGLELNDTAALHEGAGRVTAVVEPPGKKRRDEDLYVFDTRTGQKRDVRSFREDVARSWLQALYVHENGLVVAVRWGSMTNPFTAYRTW